MKSSAQARTEVERNLRAKLPAALPAFSLLADHAVQWVDDPPSDAIRAMSRRAHPKDVPILAAAVGAGCSTLLTFNVRDYRPTRGSILIETPGELLTRLRAQLAALAAD